MAKESKCTKCYYGTSFSRNRANANILTATHTHTILLIIGHGQETNGHGVFIITPLTNTNRGSSLRLTSIDVYNASTQVYTPIFTRVDAHCTCSTLTRAPSGTINIMKCVHLTRCPQARSVHRFEDDRALRQTLFRRCGVRREEWQNCKAERREVKGP